MSTQLIVCLVIFVLTCAGYIAGVWSLATVAMASVAAFSLTGCLSLPDALSCFSNGTVIMIGAMSVVAAGFGKTRFCSALAGRISRLARGNASLVLLLYCILTMILSQFVQSPVIVIGIAAPLCLATVRSMGLSASRFVMPIGVVSISTCSTLPIGAGATQAAELSGYINGYYSHLAQFTGSIPDVGFFDPMIARLPLLICTVLYCAFVMPRFCPERTARIPSAGEAAESARPAPLSSFSEACGIVIFFATAVALMLQGSILNMMEVWQICLIGAVLMILFGVLQPAEARNAIPINMLLLTIGSIAMAAALSATGAGDLIGGFIAGMATGVNNNYLIGLIFFIFPFLLAQFMSNRGAMLIFFPIAIATCHSIGGDPRGLMILIEAGALTAYMTPMPTAAVPCMMEFGGYSQKDLLRGGWLHSVISCVLSVGWIMTVMPVR